MGLPSRTRPSRVVHALEVTPSNCSSLASKLEEPSSTKRWGA
jgi:hypothetical protein